MTKAAIKMEVSKDNYVQFKIGFLQEKLQAKPKIGMQGMLMKK